MVHQVEQSMKIDPAVRGQPPCRRLGKPEHQQAAPSPLAYRVRGRLACGRLDGHVVLVRLSAAVLRKTSPTGVTKFV